MNASAESLYAAPKPFGDKTYHYHTIDLPGIGTVEGEWDLRHATAEYLGNVDFRGKRVLEMGTADGYLCYWMEQHGADVVAYDLSDEYPSDVAPSRYPLSKFREEQKDWIRAVNGTWWKHHEIFRSRAKVVYGTVYDVPQALGEFDICTYGSILLHLRDPYLALYNGLRLTRETAVVTEPIWTTRKRWVTRVLERFAGPYMTFMPAYWLEQPMVTWWILSPAIIRKFVAALGFERTELSYHTQLIHGRKVPMYTVVGHRTQPLETP